MQQPFLHLWRTLRLQIIHLARRLRRQQHAPTRRHCRQAARRFGQFPTARPAELPFAPHLIIGCVATRHAAQPREERGGRRLFVGFGERIFQRFGCRSGQLQAGQCSTEQCMQAWIGGVGRVHGSNLTRQGHLRDARWRAVRVGVPVKLFTRNDAGGSGDPHAPPAAERRTVHCSGRQRRCKPAREKLHSGRQSRSAQEAPTGPPWRVVRPDDMGKVAMW